MSNYADRMLRLDMAMTQNGTPRRRHFIDASRRRGNRRQGDNITDISHLVPPRSGQNHRLWITDRILEPQTIPHFLEFLMHGRLPATDSSDVDGDRKTSLPLLTVQEAGYMNQPFPDWAPAPFNVQARSTNEWIGIRIGSYEDSARLWPIAKELHAMKSRLWEGIPPVSERRWKELQLDDPRHFKDACQYFVTVIDVFAYLNNPRTKNALRTTYNLIWDHLKVFEQAVNAKRRDEAEDGVYEEVSVTGLWYQYIRAHYDFICEHAHQWVIEHINRIREPIVLEIGSHQPAQRGPIDGRQQELTDMIHDLAENTSQADYSIFMPTDGYKGDKLPSQERLPLTEAHKAGFRENPISWSANINWRACDYTQRVRFLDRKEMYEHFQREGILFDTANNDPQRLLIICISQIDAQTVARQELRGPTENVEVDRWMDYGRRPQYRLKGFAAFRLCHEHDDKKWAEFKKRFEADIADWGWGKKGIDDVRQACKIHWIDGTETSIDDARENFKSIVLEQPVHARLFLAIDKATIESYLEAKSSKFVLAVDAEYEGGEENVESPGYKGTMRILGSLLWDELSAMQTTQGVFLRNLWPYAMSDPDQIYRGPVVGTPVLKFPSYQETMVWEIASVVVPLFVSLQRSGNTARRT
ncbi:hypothetical protein FLONG3_9006 [Fusarium longipes]|uniref:Uncharacterized protein n=1 Tax=Fusarium longipes TaxID=694270 RepID=A0A395S0M2_9HYPO|nr:hypothetical protein FLONG3_9006 [Fusarium longipes]